MTRPATRTAVPLPVLAVVAALTTAACGAAPSLPAPLPPQDRPAATGTTTTGDATDVPATGPTVAAAAAPVTAADRALVRAFLRFAVDPGRATAARVPFAARVRIGLSDDADRVVRRDGLVAASTWRVRTDPARGWRGRDGTVDLLALARTPSPGGHEVSVGPHRHCASPAQPAPARTAGLRRVSVQPRGYPDCNGWWTVDLFVDGDGRVRVVTADVWEP